MKIKFLDRPIIVGGLQKIIEIDFEYNLIGRDRVYEIGVY